MPSSQARVRNVLTGRNVLEANAVHSNYHGGFIHVNDAMHVITKMVLREADIDFTYDHVSRSLLSTKYVWLYASRFMDCIHSVLAVEGVEIVGNSFDVDGVPVYTQPSVTEAPDGMYVNVKEYEFVPSQSSNGTLSFKEFKAIPQSDRPRAIGRSSGGGSLVLLGTRRILKLKADSTGNLVKTYRSMHIDNHGREIIEYDSTTRQAIYDYNNALHFSSGGNGSMFGYHRGGQYRAQFDAQMETGKWYFGLEAEKQDADAKAYAEYLSGECGQWCAERDSSLCGRSGAEFITPIMPLHNGSEIRKSFQLHRWMLDASIDNNGNANRTACGGHMTISKKGMSGQELMSKLNHFMPLLYSLYIGRLNTNYGGAVRKAQTGSTRRAVSVKSFGVEIRIFSAVPSMEGAWWRVQLLQVIADMIDSGEVQSYKDVANAIVTDKHPLRKVLRKQYDSKRLRDKFSLTLMFGHIYETNNADIDLTGTSNDVVHKSSRIRTAYNQFRDVRHCLSSVWGISEINPQS